MFETISDVLIIFIVMVMICKLCCIVIQYVLNKIMMKTIKEVEKNPKWLTPKLKKSYYGFNDIDIILAKSPFPILPSFRITKDLRYQVLVPEDTRTDEIDLVAQLALSGKIKLKYNLLYLDKPVHWLSALCYMLDGGEVCVTDIDKNKV